MRSIIATTILIAAILTPLGSFAKDEATKGRITVKAGTASPAGFMQTPNGGKDASASLKRPTIREFGVKNSIPVYEISAQTTLAPYSVYARAELIRIQSWHVLESDLECRIYFAAGKRIRTHLLFDTYGLGVKRDFELFTPKAEVTLLSYSIKLESDGWMEFARRSYTKAALRVGAEKRFNAPGGELYIDLMGSVPLPYTPNITEASVGYDMHFFEKSLTAGIAAKYQLSEYEDKQPIANHVKLELKKAVFLSLGYSF
ncbi:MAG: hypothetical protein OEV59_02430 [Deltaproteobacteria bacterium]|nr:hypothetical protein [Deltaproteobacteria bacterium]